MTTTGFFKGCALCAAPLTAFEGRILCAAKLSTLLAKPVSLLGLFFAHDDVTLSAPCLILSNSENLLTTLAGKL